MEKRILSDSDIVDLFFSRDERAIKELSAAYGTYLSAVASNVLKNKEDCDECLNDVYLLLWNHIPPVKPKNLRAYAAKTVRNAALRKHQSRFANETLPIDELPDVLAGAKSSSDELDEKLLKETINRCIRSLSARERYIFIGRYYNSDSVSNIARSLRVSKQAVYKSLSRIKDELGNALRKEGFLL